MVDQALNERDAVKADMEYAKSLTRVAETPFGFEVAEFRQAGDTLAEIIALQEVRLETGKRRSAFGGEGKLVEED